MACMPLSYIKTCTYVFFSFSLFLFLLQLTHVHMRTPLQTLHTLHQHTHTSIPRIVELDRLLILLEQFKNYENVRWPAKPEQVYCDKVVMAIRGCSSITKNRQDEAIRKGAAKPLVEVLTGVHLDDRETCLRTTQCILGICTKNEKAVESFRAAGAGAALRAVLYQHRDSNSKDFQRAVALFLKDADKHSEHSRLEDELELIRSSSKASIGA